MTSIGETLRDQRLRRNLDIQVISRDLKIPAKFLDAIEREQFDKLPAAVFAKSFVRQYARYLNLPEDELASAVQHVLEPPPTLSERPPESEPRVPKVHPMAAWESVGDRRSWSSSLPALALVLVVMLGCSLVYAWWQRSRHSVAAQEAPPLASLATPAQQPAPAAPAPPNPAPPEASAAATTAAAPAPVNSADRTVAAAARPETAAAPASSSAETPAASNGATTTTPKPAGPVHVEIVASDAVWVSAKADGKTSFSATLEPNQSRVVDASDNVVLRLGNAGGAQITLNGKPIGEVGPKGQPRTVQFNAGGFQIVNTAPKPAPYDPLR